MRTPRGALWIGLILWCVNSPSHAGLTTFTTADILSKLPPKDCVDYCLTGTCIWLYCSFPSCSIKSTARVRHHNPDLLVSVFRRPEEQPWVEEKALYNSLDRKLQEVVMKNSSWFAKDIEPSAGQQTQRTANNTQSLQQYEATASGHPWALLSEFISSADLFCPSEATAYMQYYSSMIDVFSWRTGLPELIYIPYLIPGVKEIGSGFWQTWGHEYPRSWTSNNVDDVKAAAVIAHRVGHIVTRKAQPHAYIPLDGNNYSRTWLPGPLNANDPKSGVWQMVVPKYDDTCYVFGENDVFNPISWSHGRENDSDQYAFALWREYECCKKKGSLISIISFEICY